MTEKVKCVFLDRDGVLNQELGYQITETSDFKPVEGLKEALTRLKKQGFLLIVITNQSGIAKGHYTEEFVMACHEILQQAGGHLLDDLYFAPGHETVSQSLMRKPGSLMFEKAMAKHHIDPQRSWMIGDKERDILPADRLGIRTIKLGAPSSAIRAAHQAQDLGEAVNIICTKSDKMLQQP